MKQIVAIAVGGALGAVCRSLLIDFVREKSSHQFPWGTLLVNVLGCLAIGFVLQWGTESNWLTPTMRALFVTGFLGAMTTFSTFGFETVRCLESGLTLAVFNIGANVVLGIGAVLLGITVGRLL